MWTWTSSCSDAPNPERLGLELSHSDDEEGLDGGRALGLLFRDTNLFTAAASVCGVCDPRANPNDIFDTLDDHFGYGSDSGFGW